MASIFGKELVKPEKHADGRKRAVGSRIRSGRVEQDPVYGKEALQKATQAYL
jgi:hypothetical protein